MKSATSFIARPTLLAIAMVGALHAGNNPALQPVQTANPAQVKVYTGHAAVRKELEVLQQVISDTTTRVVTGEVDSDAISQLLTRRKSLEQMLTEPDAAEAEFESGSIVACGQSLQLSAQADPTPGGGAYANAYSTVQLSSVYPATVQGLVYTIIKNYYTTESNIRLFSFHSLKHPSGSYTTHSHSGGSGSWGSCGKAYATGAISDLNGNTMACGNVPVIVETEFQTSPTYNCSVAF